MYPADETPKGLCISPKPRPPTLTFPSAPLHCPRKFTAPRVSCTALIRFPYLFFEVKVVQPTGICHAAPFLVDSTRTLDLL